MKVTFAVRHRPVLSAIAIAMALALGVVARGAETSAAPTLPQPVETPGQLTGMHIEWPGAADREALVVLQFDLLVSGEIANISVRETGFHEKRFVDAAIRSLRNARGVPRRLDGVPVDTFGLLQPFTFSLDIDNPGITREFRREVEKIGELIRKGDAAGAHAHAQQMLAGKVILQYEYAVLQAQLGETFARVGNYPEALAAISQATERKTSQHDFPRLRDTIPPNHASAYLLPKEWVTQLLELRMRLYASEGQYINALQSWYELAGLASPKDDHPMAQLARQMTDAIRGTEPLMAKGTILRRAWTHYLSRRAFTITDLQGRVDSLELNCSAQKRVLAFVPDVEWKIPDSWGDCSAMFWGPPGTRFTVIELADAPGSGASP